MSDKRRREERELAALRLDVWARSLGRCEVRFSPACTGRMDGLHHLKKKSALGKHTLANVRASCNPCNTAIEDDPDRATAAGLVVKSWEDDPA